MDNLANIEQTELDLERSLSGSETSKRHHELYDHCLLCGSPQKESHHIVLLSAGGSDTSLANRAMLCGDMGNGCHKGAHGIDAGNGRWWIKRDDIGALTATNRDTGEYRVLEEKAHLLSEEDGKEAFQLHSSILECKERIEGNFFMMGDSLRQMRDTSHYMTLGYESFNAYLASPELSINRAQAYKLMNIAGQCKRLNLEPSSLLDIDKDKLALVLPSISSEEDPQIKIAAARSLSRSDLKALYSGEEPQEQDDTEHTHNCGYCGRTNTYQGS